MGQAERRVPEAAALSEADGASIGAHLARERRLRGVSLEELSELTHLPRRSLERLEAGAFDGSRDAFARGYVRIVSEALGLDVDATLARMLPEPDWERVPRRRRVMRALRGPLGLLAGAALVVSALGLWLSVRPSAPAVSPATGAPLLLRRDAVRELADSLAATAPPPAAPETADTGVLPDGPPPAP